MPELPEVETVCRGLAPHLEGRRIARVTVRRRDLRRPIPRGFAGQVEGRLVARVERRAKYILIHLSGGGSDGSVMIWHLGMSGRAQVLDGHPHPPAKHDHVIIETDGGKSVVFNDPRRFGLMVLAAESGLAEHPLLKRLGPEPLGDAFTQATLAAALAGRRGAVKTAIMDQSIVAGMGNIYASESLFRAAISPKRKASTVRGARASKLVAAIREVFREAIIAGGSTLRDHRRPDGDIGRFQNAFQVYGRDGEACPGCNCNPAISGGIRKISQAGRATFYCPHRQR
ncbi:MAG TPA: bifunctional DNA-formamidopyrimidine glycosylase/DNA-(apurinic or apyrimidinic site) lyase [Alphaproteobacteria bacterium]|nr:bifunctional DNA-formamidopyrimidine glycosylase/DNA-(apurinic or apyrimidinic site) lyase [Alphaproteobacteria bacterium]